MINKRCSRFGTLFLTGLFAVLTLAVGLHAAQTITTPNAAEVKYSLGAGDNSAAVTPAVSTPVLVMGVQNSLGYRGVGQVALLHVPSSFLEWTGIESPAAAALTSGYSGTAGTHILYLDYSHLVQIQVASADTFLIHNGNSITMTGVVTMIW
ncbi:MAG: hypothetical protein WBV55_06295 [Candidatus Sulfotelmatobacter sp.]